jgi:hypothetical protein
MPWDQRAATRADFIESIDGRFETTFGTGALVDALLNHDVSNQDHSANYYGEDG